MCLNRWMNDQTSRTLWMIRQSSTPASLESTKFTCLFPVFIILKTLEVCPSSIISSQKMRLMKATSVGGCYTALRAISDLWQGWILRSICTHCLILDYMLSTASLKSTHALCRLLVMVSRYTSCFVDHATFTFDQWSGNAYYWVSQEASLRALSRYKPCHFQNRQTTWVCLKLQRFNCRIVFLAVPSDQKKRQAYVFSAQGALPLVEVTLDNC